LNGQRRQSAKGRPTAERLSTLASGGRTWWAHFEFTRINIERIILPKKIEELSEAGATSLNTAAFIAANVTFQPRRIFVASSHRRLQCLLAGPSEYWSPVRRQTTADLA
jgi:hypothetical protein